MSRLSSAPPAPDLQSSARRREEQMALLREECGSWLPKRTDISKLTTAPRFAAAVAARMATTVGCHECAWGKVAGCWRCGSWSAS